jgi:hypothetical protein
VCHSQRSRNRAHTTEMMVMAAINLKERKLEAELLS